MSISAFGAINPTALIVPGLYVQIVPPQLLLLNGVPTNVVGLVGSASWGPVNSPTGFGTMAQYAATFGPVIARTFDMGTAAALAVLQGAQAFVGVRVTDGTDAAALNAVSASDSVKSVTVGGVAHVGDVLTLNITPNGGSLVALAFTTPAGPTLQGDALALQALVNGNTTLQAAGITADTPIAGVFNIHYLAAAVPTITGVVTGAGATTTLTIGGASTLSTVQRTYASLWTGSLGNQIVVTESAGSALNTTRVSVTIPGRVPEVFDNIAGAGAVLNANIATAINQGQSGLRGPSQIVKVTAGFGTTSPASLPVSYTLTAGLDGASNIVTANMVGVDTYPRTGMFALRSQGVSVAALVDLTDTASWSTQNAFGLSEGVYMMLTRPASDTISAAVTAKQGAGLDTWNCKVCFGDWILWADQTNGVTRLVSPQGVFCGLFSNNLPSVSSLNKQVFGIVGTQASNTGQNYSNADLQTLAQAGIDVIGNASAISAGNYFAPLIGHNASSNAVINGDNYTRMTNFIATTINAGMGPFVGKLNNPTVQGDAMATLNAFFGGLFAAGLIGTPSGTSLPWSLQLNNAQAALGLLQINVSVSFLPVVEKLLVNIQGGQTVTISRLSTAPNI
jgi:hypothetical protein